MSQVTLTAGPFGSVQHVEMPLGLSIRDIAGRISKAGTILSAFLRSPEGAKQQWEWVDPARWPFIKPKGENCLRFEYVPAGGGGRNNVFGTIAAVLVTVAAPYLAGAATTALAGAGAFLLGSQAAALSQAAFTAAFAIGGSLGVSKLFGGAQAATGRISGPSDDAQSAFLNLDSDINVLAKDTPPPKIRGYRRVSLPSACAPHKYLENGQDVIEVCLVASGYHSAANVKIGKVDINQLDGVEYQIRDGSDAAAQQTLIKRVTKTTSVGEEFKKFTTQSESLVLTDQVNPENSEPAQIIVAPGYNEKIEQITLRLQFDPLLYQSSDTELVRVPIRISMWQKSAPETVHNLPEIAVIGRSTTRLPKEIKLRWDDGFGFVSASTDFRYEFWREVPATSDTLSDGSSGTQWEAHSMFSSGSGYRDTQNIFATLDGVNVTLDPSVIPKGDYEIGVTVGMPVRDVQFSSSTYALNGTVRSLFRGKDNSGRWQKPEAQDGVFGGATFDYGVMVVKRRPVEAPGFWQMPIKFRGVSAKNITLEIGAYTYDWGGSAWDDLSITKNPAPHYRDTLREVQTFLGVDTSLNADDEFLAWRQECETKGYEVNMACAGQPLNEVLESIATAGLATKRFGAGYGIEYFRNRDDETPECTFTHRDSKISFTRQFPYSPKGAVIKYEDEDNEYVEAEAQVNNQWKKTDLGANKIISLPQVTSRECVRRIGALDLLQDAYQDTIWNIETGPAGYHRKRGAMIGVITDLDTDHAHGFFIRQVTGPRSVAVDRAVAATSEDALDSISDLTLIEDLLIAGETAVAHILEPDGLNTYTIASVAENVITFTEDLPESWDVTEPVEGSDETVTYPREALAGTRMSVAARDDLFRKMIVLDVDRQSQGGASIKAVEYRPEIAAWLEKYHP